MKRVCAAFNLNSKREKFWSRKFSENSLKLFGATHFRVRNPNSSQLNYAQNFHVQSHWFSRSFGDRQRTHRTIPLKPAITWIRSLSVCLFLLLNLNYNLLLLEFWSLLCIVFLFNNISWKRTKISLNLTNTLT